MFPTRFDMKRKPIMSLHRWGRCTNDRPIFALLYRCNIAYLSLMQSHPKTTTDLRKEGRSFDVDKNQTCLL